jgi:hypothetical protein
MNRRPAEDADSQDIGFGTILFAFAAFCLAVTAYFLG